MTRSVHLLAAVPLAVLSLALAAPALADETCDPLDATCVVSGAAGSGQQGVANTIDTVTGTAKPIADDPQGTVDRILHPGIVDPPGDGGGGSGGDQPIGGHTGDRPPATGPQTARGSQVGRPAGSRPSGPRSAGSSLDPSTISVPPPSKDPVSADEVAGAFHAVAPTLGVVIALFAVALGFVMVQDRLDRRDPKLSLAPVQTEMMGFS
jgi:hypothetical protein